MTIADQLTVGRDSAPEAVAALLEKHGIAVIPRYLGDEQLEKVRGEAGSLIKDEDAAGVIERDYASGASVLVECDRWNPDRYPAIASLLKAPFMREVAIRSMGRRCKFNQSFLLTHETTADVPITDLHYDRLPTLKFFIYLLDTDRSNGAFECVPGTHRRVREIREHHLRRGVRMVDLPNFSLPQSLAKPVPIEGPAGTMLVFTTDLFHQGGVVSPGRERWVLRANTRPDPLPVYEPRPWRSRQWWRESAFNPMRYLYRAADALMRRRPPYSDAR